MQTSVTFKNIDSSDALRSYVAGKLDRFDRLLDNPAEAQVVLSVQKFRHIAEINLVGDRLSITGKEETEDMYSAIDLVLDKLEKQIKKSKQKTRDRRGGRGRAPAAMTADAPAALAGPAAPEVIDESIEYKPMDVEEAVLQMELITDDFLVFTNARTERVNVLYRRQDGNFGLIQPA